MYADIWHNKCAAICAHIHDCMNFTEHRVYSRIRSDKSVAALFEIVVRSGVRKKVTTQIVFHILSIRHARELMLLLYEYPQKEIDV